MKEPNKTFIDVDVLALKGEQLVYAVMVSNGYTVDVSWRDYKCDYRMSMQARKGGHVMGYTPGLCDIAHGIIEQFRPSIESIYDVDGVFRGWIAKSHSFPIGAFGETYVEACMRCFVIGIQQNYTMSVPRSIENGLLS